MNEVYLSEIVLIGDISGFKFGVVILIDVIFFFFDYIFLVIVFLIVKIFSDFGFLELELVILGNLIDFV